MPSTRETKPSIDWAWLRAITPRVALGGLLFGWLLAFAGSSGPRPASGNWGGDYPAFYTAGRIVLTGQADHLYDIGTQQALESELLDDGYLEFLYPPFVAGSLAPLALLPYRASYLLFTLISFAALLGAVACVRPLSTLAQREPWLASAAAASFYPLFRAMLGGQNTALSLLILCGAWRLLHDRRDVLAGVVLGLLAFKPQYLVPVAGVVLLAGRLRSMAGMALTGALLYAAGAAVSGWEWPVVWLHEVGKFSALDREFNAANSISLDSVVHALGWDSLWVVFASLLSGSVAWTAWKRGRDDIDGVFVFAIAASVLIAPHAMFYDFGIVLPALLLLVDRGRGLAAAAVWLASACPAIVPETSINPMVVVAGVLLVLVRLELRESAPPAA